jgi:hypothetical protein
MLYVAFIKEERQANMRIARYKQTCTTNALLSRMSRPSSIAHGNSQRGLGESR